MLTDMALKEHEALSNLHQDVLKLSKIPPTWWETLDEVLENFIKAEGVSTKSLLECIHLIGPDQVENMILATAPEECSQCTVAEVTPGYFKLERPCGFHEFTDGWV